MHGYTSTQEFTHLALVAARQIPQHLEAPADKRSTCFSCRDHLNIAAGAIWHCPIRTPSSGSDKVRPISKAKCTRVISLCSHLMDVVGVWMR